MPERTSNVSVDDLLDAAKGCREVVLLAKEPHEVMRVVSEGGGMRQFSPYVRKVTVRACAHKSNVTR